MITIPDYKYKSIRNSNIINNNKSIYDLDQYSSVIKINIEKNDNLDNKLNIKNDDIKNDLGINDYSKYGKIVDNNDKKEVIKNSLNNQIDNATNEVKELIKKSFNIDISEIKSYLGLFLLFLVLYKFI